MKANIARIGLAVAFVFVLAGIEIGCSTNPSTLHAQSTGITIAQLAGGWQVAMVGNTGCGTMSLLWTGTLDSSGVGNGTLTSSSGCGVLLDQLTEYGRLRCRRFELR